jgi:hypothetical protein
MLYPHTFTGLPPKTSRRNPANGMTTGKRKDKEVANGSKGAWGFFIATTQSPSTSGTAGTFEFCSGRPIAFSLSKPLEAACQGHDTHGAGVVTQAHENIVVV